MWWVCAEVFILMWIINVKRSKQSALRRQGIRGVLHNKKILVRMSHKWQMLTHIVQHLGPNVATVQSSWCAPSRSIPLKGSEFTGRAWKGVKRGASGLGRAARVDRVKNFRETHLEDQACPLDRGGSCCRGPGILYSIWKGKRQVKIMTQTV